MISVYDLKPRFQSLLRPLVNFLANAGVTANQVTLAALILSLLTGLSLWLFPMPSRAFLVIPVVLFIRMALNAIDGMLAREHNMQSPLGCFLNELSDVVADVALFLPLLSMGFVQPKLFVLTLFVFVLVEMTGFIATEINASRRYDGPMGKSDRALALGLLTLAYGLQLPVTVWLNEFLIALFLLSSLTLYTRIHQAIKEVQHG